VFYVKHYSSGYDSVGFETLEEALGELDAINDFVVAEEI
jgi:hypothetical protein